MDEYECYFDLVLFFPLSLLLLRSRSVCNRSKSLGVKIMSDGFSCRQNFQTTIQAFSAVRRFISLV